jgi:carbon-monoxide dehydrogenase medium subunit
MYPSRFAYQRAENLTEALTVLDECKDAIKILAGGQSLIPLMKLRMVSLPRLLDVGRLQELHGICQENGLLRIRALSRHADLERFLSPPGLEMLREGARVIADPQVRNLGTLGGALAEADPAGDWPAVFLALDTSVVCRSVNETRRLSIGDFFLDAYTTALKPEEILTELEITLPRAQSGSAYLKFERKSGDFAIASAAVMVEVGSSQEIRRIGIGLAGVGLIPMKASKAEAVLRGQRFEPEILRQAGEALMNEIEPLADLRGSSEYKRNVAGVLFQRAFTIAWERAGRASRPEA